MNFIELKFRGKVYTHPKEILEILESERFYWLIDSEVNDAIIEIINNTLIWHGGDFLSGDWHYGIFNKGEFYGTWHNGIWESGQFNGEWISGIKK